MEIADLFTGSIRQMWRKPVMTVANVVVWFIVFMSTFLLVSNIFPLTRAFAFTCFNIFALMAVYYLNVYLIDRYLERKQYAFYLFCFFLIFVLTVLTRIVFNLHMLEISEGKFPLEQKGVYLATVFTTLIVLTISFFNGLLMNRSRKEKEYQGIIAHQREAQVEFLKSQMSPHFLFNTLNNIYSLSIGKASPASEMILLLSDILRYAVYETRQSKVILSSEILQIQKLIQLYQLKSESPLPVSFQVNVSSSPVFLEPMILIPMVENCFKHCNLETSEQAYITIQLTEENGYVSFETTNSKEDVVKAKLDDSGVGLKNIRERLAIRYPGKHTLTTQEKSHSYSLYLQIQTRE